MTTTISKTNKSNLSPGTIRTRRAAHLGRDWLRPGGIARDPGRSIDEGTSSRGRAFLAGARAIVPVLLALLPFGLAFGATATGNGLSAIEALGMSVFVFAGAAQLAAVPLLSAGASVAIVLLTVLVINLRLTLYSASLAPHFGRLPAGWKGLLAYLLTDQAYAATITPFDEGETEEPDKRWYYLGVALAIWITWQAATMLGIVLGAWASEGWSRKCGRQIRVRTTTAVRLSGAPSSRSVADGTPITCRRVRSAKEVRDTDETSQVCRQG